MLTLTRYPGQRIMIGDDIIVQISQVRGRNVRVDILAPREIPVHREEIYRRIQAEIEAEGRTAMRPRKTRTGADQ
ncbi:MAG TPA: carbon storage regulator [Gammaproteobacteria bacterium]|nr:carbon storage regulator [Gammaproteobacteria bacterium]